jgi:polyisoprenyl-teichoic acid--peptidoglycan teichoic acid transferase
MVDNQSRASSTTQQGDAVRRVGLYVVIGLLVVVLGGVALGRIHLFSNPSHPQAQASATPSTPGPSPSPSPLPGAGIKGPLNILIVGVDTRESIPGWVPHADSDMILHVDKDLTSAYLVSLPRDLLVNIPAYRPSHFGGERTKLTHAMSFGSLVAGHRPSPRQGLGLVAETISRYTGIRHFDAEAVLTFTGLARLVNALGGVDLYVDQLTTSISMRPDGKHRAPCSGCAHGYTGPQAVYTVGMHHLVGWQALDYARQRYIPGSDYARQRHQRQLIQAIIKRAYDVHLIDDPSKLFNVVKVLSSTLIVNGNGHTAVDYAFALRHLPAQAITLVGLPGSGVYSGGQYLGEQLNPVEASYFAALRQDNIAAFVKAHPTLVNRNPLP